MPWIIGIDEAGYGPNLGPLTMTAVACRVHDDLAGANLWNVLGTAVRKAGLDDDRIVVDDSKQVYGSTTGIAALERGVLASLWRRPLDAETNLGHFLSATCADSLDELRAESWHKGEDRLPGQVDTADLATASGRFDKACADAGVLQWQVHGVIMPAPRYNVVAETADSKGAALADALGELLVKKLAILNGDDRLSFFVDKHGGRNRYTALIQHCLSDGMVVAEEEGALRSHYRVIGLKREVRLTFQPRADGEHFCVALASMTAKYLRERLMEEFNRFWLGHVPGLKPTAGYPNDALRFMDSIRPAARRLGIEEHAIWRKR